VTATITSSNWNWTENQTAFTPSAITYGNGKFVIVESSAFDTFEVLSSCDGIIWNDDSTFSFDTVYNGFVGYIADFGVTGIAYGNGIFVASVIQYGYQKSSPYMTLSEDFVSTNLLQWSPGWNSNAAPSGVVPQAIAYGGNEFIGSFLGNVYTSLDGLNWTNRTTGTATCIGYGQGAFLACGYVILNSGIFSSVTNNVPTSLTVNTFAGVTIRGTAGMAYQIQCATNLDSPWLPLTNFSLPYSPYLWVDTSSPVSGQRFYRSVQMQ